MFEPNAQNHANAGVSCRLPRIWREQPKIWFCHVESVLEENNVVLGRSKYNLVVGALDFDTFTDFANILISPPQSDKYGALKMPILQRLTDPPVRQLQKIFSEVQLEGYKPSQLFRYMCALVGDHASVDVSKAHWLTLLPNHVQSI